jgi:hypothetical protein
MRHTRSTRSRDVRDKAVALEQYARQAENTEAERQACEIRLRAERKAGQILATTVKRGQLSKKENGPRGRILLKDARISEKQSKSWQKLGAVPQKTFDYALEQADKPTTKGIIKATSEPKPNPVSDDAIFQGARAPR